MAIQITLPQTQRQGTFPSGSFTVPATGLQAFLIIRPLIVPGDLADPTLSFKVNLQVFDGAQGVWRHLAGADWRGGQPPPAVCLATASLVGKQVRVEVDIPERMRLGATIEDSAEDLG